MNTSRFAPLHQAMQAQVDQGFLSGVATALLRGGDVVDRFVCGMADMEAGEPLRDDHIFRVFSNTKLPVSLAVLLLAQDGRLTLDDPAERYLPALGRCQVLRPGATSVDDVVPLAQPITVRHLLTHTSGMSYGLFDPGTLLFGAYKAAGVHNPALSQAEFVEKLAALPLVFQPGEGWEYSLGTDVLGALIEAVSGQSLGAFFQQRIFGPLGMVDTAFWVPEDKRQRLTALYGGVDFMDPLKPGLRRLDHLPYPGAYMSEVPRQSGGGGLVSTLDDQIRLVQALMPGGTLLPQAVLADAFNSHVRPDQHVRFPNMPTNPGKLHGLVGSVLQAPSSVDPADATDEVSWGGMAGTVWWINPRLNTAGVLMTQRYFGFGNPFSFEFRRHAYDALA